MSIKNILTGFLAAGLFISTGSLADPIYLLNLFDKNITINYRVCHSNPAKTLHCDKNQEKILVPRKVNKLDLVNDDATGKQDLWEISQVNFKNTKKQVRALIIRNRVVRFLPFDDGSVAGNVEIQDTGPTGSDIRS